MEKYLYSDRKILENEAKLCNDKIKDHTMLMCLRWQGSIQRKWKKTRN